MTSHLEEGVLQELLDGEIPSSELAPIQAHLALCAECRARLDEARALGAEADRLIETIDLAEPRLPAAPRVQPARPRNWIRNVAWAATLVIAAGTGYLARSTDSLGKEQLPVPPAEEAKMAAASRQADTTPPALDQPSPTRVRDKGAARGMISEGVKPERSAAANEVRREPASSLTTAVALEKASARRDTALALNEIVTSGVADAARPAAPSQAGGVTAQKALALRAAPAASETVNRLEEMTALGAATRRAPYPVEITFPDALRRLDGSLRLIEGLVPLRLEVLGVDVRVVYPLGSGELLLAQRLENGKLTYRLQAPPGFPADSLERLRARVHD
jgi:hypothetical protein